MFFQQENQQKIQLSRFITFTRVTMTYNRSNRLLGGKKYFGNSSSMLFARSLYKYLHETFYWRLRECARQTLYLRYRIQYTKIFAPTLEHQS